MKKLISGFIAITLLFPFASLFSYQEKWSDPSYAEDKGEEKNSAFKLGGNIFSSYEFVDRDESGDPDHAGPTKQDQGFAITRAYLDLVGKVESGDYKGWDYRMTTDAFPAAKIGDGCASNCTQNNDYSVIIKFAYFTVPVLSKTYLRFGQQHTPQVDGKGGVSLQSYWGHRYIAQQTLEETGITSSTDRGIGLIHTGDYFGLHLLFANGEGYHKTSAQDLSARNDLKKLAYGSGDSYGYDLYGMISLIPTGKSKNNTFSVNFPFRLHNVWGIEESEVHYTTADITNLAAPTITRYEGDTRAKRDLSYGVEADLSLTLGELKWTLGGGATVKVDRRSKSIRQDIDGINYLDMQDIVNNTYWADDARGSVSYLFTHIRLKKAGFFARYTLGTATDKLDGKVGVADGRPWLTQVTIFDAQDGIIGNTSLNELNENVDLGQGRFRSVVYGVSYEVSPTFTVALGVSELYGQNGAGKEFRTNSLEQVPGEGATTDSLAEQIENSPEVKSALGYGSSEKLVLNDFIGKARRNRQIFIRTNFVF